MKVRLALYAWAVIAGLRLAHATEQSRYWEIETYGYYSSGDYGGDEKTETIYWPLTIKHGNRFWRATATVPYLQIKSPGVHDGRDDGTEVIVDSERTTQSGLGDVFLKGTWHFLDQRAPWPWMSGFLRIKLPSADRDKRLGTGETDIGVGLETVRMFPNRFIALFDIDYTFIGTPSGARYENPLSISIGTGYLTSDHLLVAASYEWRQAISPHHQDPQNLTFLVNYRIQNDLRLFAIFDMGLNDATVDYGFGTGLSYRL